MSKAVLATLADKHYPTSKAATEHGEKLWRKHSPVMSRFESEQDKGRAQNAIHIVAMLTDAGEHRAAKLVEDMLDWMCEPAKPKTKAQQSIAGGMAGKGGE